MFGTPSASQVVLLLIMVAGLAWAVSSGVQRLRRSRKSRSPSMDEGGGGGRTLDSSAVRDVEEVMAHLDDLARCVHARLDMKLASLEMLIHEADQRIESLTRVMRSGQGGSVLDVTLTSEDSTGAADASQEEPGRFDQASVFRLFDRGRTVLEIAQEVGRTTGEIELMLALRRTRAEAEKSASR